VGRLLRVIAVLAGLVGIALVVVAGTRVWAHVTLTGMSMQDLPLSGRKAAPTAIPIALAVGAALFVMATAGRVLRLVVAVLVAAGGVGVVLVSQDARANATEIATRSLESTLGVFNQSSMIKLPPGLLSGAEQELTVWPLVSIAGGVLIALSGLIGLVTGLRWPGPASRFDSPVEAQVPQPVPAETRGPETRSTGTRTWDALSRGDDPT